MSALHLAVEAGSEEEVERLLSSQTLNIDAQDAEGYTALHRAVINGDEKIVESLLAAGARSHERRGIPKRPNLHGPNALHFAAAGGHWHIMHLILDHEEEYGAITSSLFLNVRCSWQTEDEGTINTTPLLLAASGPSRQHEFLAIKLLERLLRNEGQVPYGHSSRRGYTIIHLSAMKGHAKLLKWALDNGGSVNPVADPWQTIRQCKVSPIHLAAQHGHIATAQLLLEHGEDVNSRTRGDKVTALHCAALSGKESMFHFLLEAGADPLGRCSFTTLSSDFENVTVAHLAAHANNVGY